MCKQKVVFRHDAFVDYEGNNRKFCLAAVSVEECTPNVVVENEDYYTLLPKKVLLGVSVCHPEDEKKYSKELAERIAEGKALNFRSTHGVLYASNKGYINTKVVNAFLEQESEFLKVNPGLYIAGYNRAKERFLAKKS